MLLMLVLMLLMLRLMLLHPMWRQYRRLRRQRDGQRNLDVWCNRTVNEVRPPSLLLLLLLLRQLRIIVRRGVGGDGLVRGFFVRMLALVAHHAAGFLAQAKAHALVGEGP